MTISDETLMAYADGELDLAAREAVESALREDPQIEKRLAQHRALRQQVQTAYSAELAEDVPERLLAAAKGAASKQGSRVVNLQDLRSPIGRNTSLARPWRSRWQTAGAIAASLALGVGLGFFMWGRTESMLVRSADGALLAGGQLAEVLSAQLAAEQSPGSSVRIGLSFLAKSGDYCRAFALSGALSTSGLACRHGEEWQVQALIQAADGKGGNPEYRTAGSALSPAIIQAVEGQIAGEPLDEAAERAARRRDWKAGVR